MQTPKLPTKPRPRLPARLLTKLLAKGWKSGQELARMLRGQFGR